MNIKKENFLSGCLLESLEDENLSNSKGLLKKYHANPFKIIYGRGIAPIHYASGMENVIFAEEIIQLMLIMLNQEAGNVDVQTDDGETPLHIASFWGRGNIVKMLLNHNANIDIIDNDNNTAINCALQEGHFHIIDIFKKWIFEKKFFKKLSSVTPPNINNNNNNNNSEKIKLPSNGICGESTPPPPPLPPPAANKHLLLHVNRLNEQKYTPNRKNFNYDITSPYYINITHRRKKDMKNKNEIIPADEDDEIKVKTVKTDGDNNNNDDNFNILKTNLFELTEENLYEYSKSLNSNTTENSTENYGYNSTNRKKSLVNAWREKVNSYRNQQQQLQQHPRLFNSSNIHSMEQLDEIISKYDTIIDENLNVTLLPDNRTDIIINSDDCDLSFETAKSGVNESNFIKSPKLNEYILQATEEYIHTDDENGIMFLEKKTLPYNVINPSYLCNNRSQQTSPSTEYTIPLEYDTDTLRAELTQFGECPGPITKSTKRLYVKRIIKYKRKPELAINKCTNSNNNQPIYPVELQKTLQSSSVDCWQTIILSYSDLECKLIDYFNSDNAKKLKLREGHLKTSFIYLLIDPRISENLPGESKLISKHDAWKKFISSIFYVGKGKSSRPYSHLYQAIQFYQQQQQQQQQMVQQEINDKNCKDHNDLMDIVSSRLEKLSLIKKTTTKNNNKFTADNKKLQKIIDIWQSGKGVVCLHVYHNIIPVEAYTREAAIIDSLSLFNLTNLKRGDYYGITQSWNCRMRRQLGILLLYKALQIFIQEGESQLKPKDIL